MLLEPGTGSIFDAGSAGERRREGAGGDLRAVSPHGWSDELCSLDWIRRTTWPSQPRWRPVVRVADLFCGCGGLSLGVREALTRLGFGFEVALAVDSDATALAVYRANFGDGASQLLQTPVEELLPGTLGEPASRTESELLERLGRVDIIVAGPPCQGHSNLNNRSRRTDARNELYVKVARLVELARPDIVMIENVATAPLSKQGVVDEVRCHLERLGYTVAALQVNTALLGLPQTRTRHVLVAARDADIADDGAWLKRFHGRDNITIGDYLGDLLGRASDEVWDSSPHLSPDNRVRIEYLHEVESRTELPNELRPPCHRDKPGHRYGAMYGKLSWEGRAQTITTGFGSMGQGRYVHPKEPRLITPHEAARLQGFPEFFDFSTTTSRKALQRLIGNAVPPKLSAFVLANLLERIPALASEEDSMAKRPAASDDAALARMKRQKQRDTRPELVVRRLVHASGARYMTENKGLPGSPDLANRRRRWAIFVHGCYWHHHEGCSKATIPARNQEFWLEKFAANRRRDAAAVRALEEQGFRVLVIWECETRDVTALGQRLDQFMGQVEDDDGG